MMDTVTATDVCAVVITYHPDQSALDCLRATIAQSAHTIIFDNASDATSLSALREFAKRSTVTLVESPVNVGVASGLNQAIRAAFSLGYRWYLLLDQDSLLMPGAVDEITRICRQAQVDTDSKVGLIGANYFHQMGDGVVLPAKVPYAPVSGWVEAETIITSGTLISWLAFSAIGLFRDDYFIDSVDHEYCFRARRAGYRVLQSINPVMIHRLGMTVNRQVWFRFGRSVSLSCHSSLRRYYQVRNFCILAEEYGREFPPAVARIRGEVFKDIKRAVLFEGKPIKLLLAIFRGLIDAKRGLLGKCKHAF